MYLFTDQDPARPEVLEVMKVLQAGDSLDEDPDSCEAEISRRAAALTAAVQELMRVQAEERVAQIASAMENARAAFSSAVEQHHVLGAAQAIRDLRDACQPRQSARLKNRVLLLYCTV
jgi:hypothetical protein